MSIKIIERRTIETSHDVDLTKPHWWNVTTEGDVEGRRLKNLGCHFGTLYEVARRLASGVGYRLQFTWVDPETMDNLVNKIKMVDIQVNGVKTEDLVEALKQADVTVSSCNVHQVTIRFDD